jgi:DNA-binding NtrC family response regulator
VGITIEHKRSEHVVTSLRMEVVDGPDKGKQATATDTAIVVGTAPDNQLVLTDFTVSRYHLEAKVLPGGIAVADLGSTNGTYVGPVRIERALVPAGTTVRLGGTTIRFDDAVRTQVAGPSFGRLAGMLATSPAMLRLFADIERIATTSASVLVVGESGTGRERVAEALHAHSGRGGALVTIDCGALPSALLSSELFGHERGAFTGADRQHVGAFERAGAGTVFLDEIGELPPADQVALLGVLERRRFRRVGGTTELELAARVVAATNRDLRAEVNNNRFRHDLYHRLAVVVLRLPPLRDRPEDILLLVDHFARELGIDGAIEDTFGSELLQRWQRHPWPGNVRELRNAVESAMIIGRGTSEESGEPIAPYKEARAAQVGSFERAYVTRLMREAEGNVSRASRMARMDRSHLIDLIRRHDIK